MIDYRAKAPDFGAWLDRNVGKVGYLIGTRGQTCTQAMIDYRLQSNVYESYWTNIRLYASQWLGKVVADCMGIYEMFLSGGAWDKPLSAWKYPDVTTSTVYSLAKSESLKNGLIATLPRDEPYPIAVGYTGHVGFYYKGVVYQSSGHHYGLEKTDLTSTAHNHAWQYWYYLPWLDYTVAASGGGGDNMLSRGDKGDQVIAWQKALIRAGYPLPRWGADGDFGGETETATKAFQTAKGLSATGIVTTPVFCAMTTELLRIESEEKAQLDAAKIKIAQTNADLTAANNNLLVATNKISAAKNALG